MERRRMDLELLNQYLDWKREKELYPPKWSPEEYAEHVLNMEARGNLNLIYDMLFDEQYDDADFRRKVAELIG